MSPFRNRGERAAAYGGLEGVALPKWSGLLVTGKPVTEEEAAAIIIRTGGFDFLSNESEFELKLYRELGVRVEIDNWRMKPVEKGLARAKAKYRVLNLSRLRNHRVVSCWIGGPHGWRDWNGSIGACTYNIGKYPDAIGVLDEWAMIAAAFPGLSLTCQLLSGEIATTQEVWDHHGGVADLKKRRLRMIGDPEQRYREDPIRMLRAVRLSASRGLEIDAATRRPIRRLAGLLAHVPPSRLLDEMLKLLLSGHAAGAVAQLRKEWLHHGVLPLLDAAMGRAAGERFVMAALAATDERVRAGKTVSPGFLFAALLWPEVLAEWRVLEEKAMPPIPALYQAMDHVMKAQAGKLAIPHRYGADMREIWAMQPRFPQRAGKRPGG